MDNFLHLLAKHKAKMLLQNNLFDLNLTVKSHLYIPFTKLIYLNYKTKKKKIPKNIWYKHMMNFQN